MRVIVYSSLIVMYILSIFFDKTFIYYSTGIVANIAILLSIFYARGLYLVSGIAFYISGFFIYLFTYKETHFFLQFHSMLGILALFIVLPFLNSLVLVGQYDGHLSKLLHFKIKNMGDLYKRSSIVSHILGLFLNIATVPIILQSLKKNMQNLPNNTANQFYIKSILRAYAFCLMWSPMEVMIIQTLQITQLNFLSLFPFLVLLVITFLTISHWIGKRQFSSIDILIEDGELNLSQSFRKIIELFILLIILVLSVSLLDRYIQQGYLFSLVILLIPISVLWAWKIGVFKKYLSFTFTHWNLKVNGLSNFFFMFISAGFFVNMLSKTNLLKQFQSTIAFFNQHLLLLFLFIAVYFLILSLVGFHPLISIVLLAELLQPFMDELPMLPLTIIIVISSLSTVMYSPFHVSTSLMASEIRVNPYYISLLNLRFALLILGFTILFTYALSLVLTFFYP